MALQARAQQLRSCAEDAKDSADAQWATVASFNSAAQRCLEYAIFCFPAVCNVSQRPNSSCRYVFVAVNWHFIVVADDYKICEIA
jgi:hypothetical protein